MEPAHSEPTSSVPERTGVLVIRVWVSEDQEGIRARITETLDVSAEEPVVTLAGSVAAVSQAVRAWLDAFVAPPAGDGSVTPG